MNDPVYTKRTCIIGIGNPLRSDDGVGAAVCKLLEEKKLPATTVIIVQQLDTGLLEEIVQFEQVIFVDAAFTTDTVLFLPVTTENYQPASSSHHIHPSMFAGLAQQLFSAGTKFYTCAIGVSRFEMGDEFSEKATANIADAVTLLSNRIIANR